MNRKQKEKAVMYLKIKELISISPGFHRSVNIKMDLSTAEKIENYIPTVKSEAVIGHVTEALQGKNNDGAIMLVGSYGTGKSHLAAFLGSVAGKTVPRKAYDLVLEKISDPTNRARLEKVLNDKDYLVVPISGTSSLTLDQQLLVSLKQTLETNGVDIELQSSFTAALDTVERWKKHYPDTYSALGQYLHQTDFSDMNDLVVALKQFDSQALQVFIKQYPKVTAGAKFELLSGEVAEVYQSACLALARHGYRGIMVIFDEFNKVLDVSIEDGHTLKTLQDLAEMACRADQGFCLNLILISHRSFAQYASAQNDTLLSDEWRKIEGRFRMFDVSSHPWETYDIVSRVLNKKQDDYYEQLVEHNAFIEDVSQHRRLRALLDTGIHGQDGDQLLLKDLVTRDCLPLHPVTIFLLPRISAKIAQNERTLFTFLAGQDGSMLNTVLDRDVQDFLYMSPAHLYDYFEELLSRSQEPEVKDIWTKVTNSLEVLAEDAIIEAEVLKTVGMIQLGGNITNLPCTREIVEFALAGQQLVREAIDFLVQSKLVFIKKSTDEIDIIEPVDFNIEQAVNNWLSENAVERPLSLLGDFGSKQYVVPQRYNHQYKIMRYLTPAYADLNSVNNILPEGILAPQFDGLDGVVVYLFPDSPQELEKLVRIALSVRDERALLVLPTSPVEIKGAICRVAALTVIYKQLVAEKMDQRALHFVQLHLSDAKQDLNMKLDKLVRPSVQTRYFLGGQELQGICDEKTLSARCSKMMADVYNKHSTINNELINRESPTTTSKRARNDVIDAILGEASDLRANLRSAQERFMFDTIYAVTELYDENLSTLNPVLEDNFPAFAVIDKFFKDARTEQKDFKPLIRQLSSPPYGIREGIIPAVLAVSVVKYKQYVTIKNISEEDCQVNAALLDKIVEMQEPYYLKLEDWNEALEIFTANVATHFGWQKNADVFFSNQFADLGNEVFRWFSSLSRYSRETSSVSRQAVMLRRIARIASHRPRQALLKDLPVALGFETVELENLDQLSDVLISCKEELDNALDRLQEEVVEKLMAYLVRFGNPQESLISLAKNMTKALAIDGVNQEWAGIVAFVNDFEGYNEHEFAYELLYHLTGVRLEDWLDETGASLFGVLESITQATAQIAAVDEQGPRVELVFHDQDNGQKFIMQECEVSDLGAMLQAHLRAAIDNFGDAIPSLEKQQVLLNILRESL